MVNARLAGRGLGLGYASGPDVLTGVDLELPAGCVTALVGCNGSGKSTLLRAFAGMLLPRAGSIAFDGQDLHALPLRTRARAIAFVPQSLEALPPLTVSAFVLGGRYAHLGFFRTVTAHDLAAAAAALGRTDAAHCAARSLNELSGGERQRVLIARALAQEAGVLLCDEPTAALDPQHQVEVFDLLAELAHAGHTVAVATHDLNLASQYADEIVVLHDGGVRARGSPAATLTPEVLAVVYGPRLVRTAVLADGRPILLARRQV